MKETKKLKIWLDTDIGDDIDDAFALLFAMELDMEIVGISTVFKNTVQRARMTKKLLKLYGNGYENVPVYAGHGTPLAETSEEYPDLCQYTPDVDDDSFAPDSERPDEAIDRLIDACHQYGKELTVIAIGPFTNIARAHMKDPRALSLVDRVVIMGGAFFRHYADWNVMCDVEAARYMFENLRGIECLGADVTHKVSIGEALSRRVLEYDGQSAACAYLSKLYKMWMDSTGRTISLLHDPLVICYALFPEVCVCENAPVAVVTEGYARGLTLNVSGYGKAHMNTLPYTDFDMTNTHLLAREVDRDAVVKKFARCWE